MKNVFKKAHEITKKIIRKGDSYRETFRLALIFVYSQVKKGSNKMVELVGTEKQVKWANDIRETLNRAVESLLEELDKKRIQEELEDEDGEAWFTTCEEIEDVRAYKTEIIEKEIKASWYIENLKYIQKLEFGEVKKYIFRSASRDMNNIFNH